MYVPLNEQPLPQGFHHNHLTHWADLERERRQERREKKREEKEEEKKEKREKKRGKEGNKEMFKLITHTHTRTSVRVAKHKSFSSTTNSLNEWTHLSSTKSTIEANTKRRRE